MTETHQTHSSRTVDCPSFTETPQHHTNFVILVATGFLLKNDFLLSLDTNRSFCSEAVSTFALFPNPKKGRDSLKKAESNFQYFLDGYTVNSSLKLIFREIPYCKQMRKQKILHSHHL